MKFSSPHLLSVIGGDDRHPREIAAAAGMSMLEDVTTEVDPFGNRMEKTLVFNPAIGALEFPEEGMLVLCEKLKEDQ